MPHTLIKNTIKALPKSAPKELEAFIKAFYDKVPSDDLDEMDPETALKTAELHLKLSKNRKNDKPAIKIHILESKDGSARAAIDIVQDDMAFLVDSVVAEIVRHKQTIHGLIYPLLHIERGATGKIKSYKSGNGKNENAESHMHIELQSILTEAQAKELEMGLLNVLKDVDYATSDWQAMRKKLQDAKQSLENAPKSYTKKLIIEYQNFLDYLHNNNFTLLGYRAYTFTKKDKKLSSQTVKNSSLGLLRDEIKPVYINEARKGLTPQQQQTRRAQRPVTIAKVNKRSTVHRRVPLDAISVKTYDKKGNVSGEVLFIGLFTSVTYSRSIDDIPYLRRKAEDVLERSDFIPQTHDYKALRHIIEKYPRDEIFQISEEDLYKQATSILRLQERPRIALYMRPDPFGRYVSCLAYVPRDRYETRLRLRFMHILEEALGGRCVNFKVTQDDSPLSRVIFFIDVNHLPKIPKYDVKEIEAKLVEAGRLWADRLRHAMEKTEEYSEQEIAATIQRYGQAFPINYHERYEIEEAIYDIKKLDDAIGRGGLALNLQKPTRYNAQTFRLKVYSPGAPVTLSEILPVLENLGLRVIAELPYKIQPTKDRTPTWIHDFRMEVEERYKDRTLDEVKELFETAMLNIWSGAMENGNLNRLVISALMDWRQVSAIRTYVRYMRQMRYPFSIKYMGEALTENPKICGVIAKIFDAYHNPEHKDNKEKGDKHAKDLEKEMRKVELLDHDRIIRTLTELVNATLRTNFFQQDEDGNPKPYISIKLNSNAISELPNPKPYREIFVYSPKVEGVHLRGDVIARGGLRWSDRHEDFRTEVLGLMKAQMVKNAVIVPVGAKGGFVVKNPPKGGDRNAVREAGIECYKIFIRGLLDITDNRKGEDIIPPKSVVRYDDNDPYLVVAADKGTATFSDIANSISLEYGHWLGDAFASGGSAGYDHKVMGITARGAWESVKRHFRELNHNTQTDNFDVIGIGDMGGDVFGNGMLLSEHICLIGAFNHLHIFCDPNPDPAKTFKERQRLFDGVMGWDKYNTKLLSKGGKIYERSAKSVSLTPEIQKAFDIKEKQVSPNELIRAMLRARTDLLWFGGIGTYIKSTDETHADVGDKSNDSLRIEASEVRAKVIGEGANLAITQAGRIEFAKGGGRINADFIDNSGGVDSSDHEVNIKILLGDVMSKPKNKMDTEARNKLLEKMTDQVADHVLRHNYQQAQAISLVELNNAERLGEHADLIRDLERKVGLDRKLEVLPSEESIENRMRAGKGLTRPEIAVLLSYSKIMFTQDLLKTKIPDSKTVERWVMKYFPDQLKENYPKEIKAHRLRREIIATMLASGLINRMGPTFVQGLMDKCGCSSADVAKAYIIVRESFGLRHLWDELESLDNEVMAQVQLKAFTDISRMTERAITWFITRLGRELSVTKDTEAFTDGITNVKKHLSKAVTPSHKQYIDLTVERGVSNGLPEKLARSIALMPVLSSACDIIRIAQAQKADINITAQVYFELGEHFHIDWMRTQAGYLPADNAWASEALDGLVDQLYGCQAGLTIKVLKDMKDEIGERASGKKIFKKWLEDCNTQADSIEPLFQDLRAAANIDLPMLVIAEQRLRALYGG